MYRNKDVAPLTNLLWNVFPTSSDGIPCRAFHDHWLQGINSAGSGLTVSLPQHPCDPSPHPAPGRGLPAGRSSSSAQAEAGRGDRPPHAECRPQTPKEGVAGFQARSSRVDVLPTSPGAWSLPRRERLSHCDCQGRLSTQSSL